MYYMQAFKLPPKPSIKKQEQKPDARRFSVIPLRAMHDKRLTRGDYVHLIALCSYCSPNGFTFVAHSTIAKLRGCSSANVSRGLKKLERYGYFEQVRKGYTSMRGSLKRVIYDETIDLRTQESNSNVSIESMINREGEAMTRANRKQAIKEVKKQTTNKQGDSNTSITFDDALLAVSHLVKTDADLLKLETLVTSGISRDKLIESFNG